MCLTNSKLVEDSSPKEAFKVFLQIDGKLYSPIQYLCGTFTNDEFYENKYPKPSPYEKGVYNNSSDVGFHAFLTEESATTWAVLVLEFLSKHQPKYKSLNFQVLKVRVISPIKTGDFSIPSSLGEGNVLIPNGILSKIFVLL